MTSLASKESQWHLINPKCTHPESQKGNTRSLESNRLTSANQPKATPPKTQHIPFGHIKGKIVAWHNSLIFIKGMNSPVKGERFDLVLSDLTRLWLHPRGDICLESSILAFY